jgi:hypothetical protein
MDKFFPLAASMPTSCPTYMIDMYKEKFGVPQRPIIEQLSDAELEAEMARRKAEKEAAKRPKPLPEPDFSNVVKQCAEYIKQLSADGYYDDDTKQYIFEAAVEAVYGRDVWDWVREKQGG